MPNDLNPCPFCGGGDLHVVSGVSWGVKCHGCWSKVQCQNSREDAVRRWNTRFKDGDNLFPPPSASSNQQDDCDWDIDQEAFNFAMDECKKTDEAFYWNHSDQLGNLIADYAKALARTMREAVQPVECCEAFNAWWRKQEEQFVHPDYAVDIWQAAWNARQLERESSEHDFLRRIVDLAWNSVTNSEEVPHTTHADELIEKARRGRDA